ncbi:MAG: FAD:protein FMN transferase [Oscillibacter sp.]|nr:FAD:protein FMN transferase [Oscillibacter sp.]
MHAKRALSALLAAALAALLPGCGWKTEDPAKARESLQIIAMDTVMTVSAYGDHSTRAAYACDEEIRRLDKLLSRTDEKSAVSALNEAGRIEGEAELSALVRAAQQYAAATGGAFDVTIAPVASAWGFAESAFRVPSQAELDALLPYVGTEHVHVAGDDIAMDGGTQIDLGGIAKGYASDRIADIFLENEAPRGMASLGGNVLAWGDRPDETPWRVAVENPQNPGEEPYAALLLLRDAYAVTSGGYQRYFEEDGVVYQHILDPETGYPARSGLTSVTVVAPCDRDRPAGTPGNGTMCDALSTALFVLGEEAALDFWRRSDWDFDLLLITEDGRVVATEGLVGALEAFENNGYRYETVSKAAA